MARLGRGQPNRPIVESAPMAPAGQSATVAMVGAGTLAVTATQTELATVAMVGAGTLTVSGLQSIPAAVAMAGVGAMTVSGLQTEPATVAMVGAGLLTLTQAQSIPATVAMAGAGVMGVTATTVATTSPPAEALVVTAAANPRAWRALLGWRTPNPALIFRTSAGDAGIQAATVTMAG